MIWVRLAHFGSILGISVVVGQVWLFGYFGLVLGIWSSLSRFWLFCYFRVGFGIRSFLVRFLESGPYWFDSGSISSFWPVLGFWSILSIWSILGQNILKNPNKVYSTRHDGPFGQDLQDGSFCECRTEYHSVVSFQYDDITSLWRHHDMLMTSFSDRRRTENHGTARRHFELSAIESSR